MDTPLQITFTYITWIWCWRLMTYRHLGLPSRLGLTRSFRASTFHLRYLGVALQSPGLGAHCSQKSCYSPSNFGPALVRGRNWNWIFTHLPRVLFTVSGELLTMHRQEHADDYTWGVAQQNWWWSAAWGYLQCGIRMAMAYLTPSYHQQQSMGGRKTEID